MIRARATQPAPAPATKRTRLHTPAPKPEPTEESSQDPPAVLPDSLVRSTILRLEHAIRWANWSMVLRVVQDARAAHQGLVQETIQPVEQRPIAILNTLGGLPNSLVYALRAIRGPAGPLQSVQDVLDLGELELARQPGLTFQRVEHVFQAIERTRAAIERDTARMLCWRLTA